MNEADEKTTEHGATTLPPETTTKPPEPESTPTTAAELVREDTDLFPGQNGDGAPLPKDAERVADLPPISRPGGEGETFNGTGRGSGNPFGRNQAPPSGDPRIDARRAADRERHQRKKYGNNPPPPREEQRPPQPSRAPRPEVDYNRMAAIMVNAGISLSVALMGEEWLPRVVPVGMSDAQGNRIAIDERAALTGATADYLRSREVKDIPPGMMLCIVVAAYATPRLTMPVTRGRMFGIFQWVKSKFSRRGKAAPPPDAKKHEHQVHEARKAEAPKVERQL